jgi:Protein kinase domain
MNPTGDYSARQYRLLRELYDRASGRPKAEWESFLEQECPADATFRSEALRLLEQGRMADMEGFLETAAPDLPGLTTEPDGAAGSNSNSTEPEFVGKYRIVRRFTAPSGQGDAFLAFDPDLERHVVIKRYHSGASIVPGEAEEGRALASVNSPYVARCHGIEWIDGTALLIVEYIPGRNLSEVQDAGSLDVARVVAIMAQLAEGVAAVHARGLIHRDIKPANVILHDDGTPRLVDFGLAAHIGNSRLHEVSGTPAYMAPEQARCEGDRIGFRTDVYGLGALLYKLLTDHEPHEGANLDEILEHARTADIRPPRQFDPTIPAAIESVCVKALAMAPENRYATALEFAAALRHAIEPTLFAPPAPVRRFRWFRWAVAAAAIAFCGLLAAGIRAWPRGGQPTSSVIPSIPPGVVAGPVQAEILLLHYREKGDGLHVEPRGSISESSLASDPPRLKDMVRVQVKFSRPTYCYLIALNPDGTVQLCHSDGDDGSRSPRRELAFPENPADYFGLTDGSGLQAFALVISDRPLPTYQTWKSLVPGGLAWAPVDHVGLWTYDSERLVEAKQAGGQLRGEILKRELVPEALIGLCDRLRHAPGVTVVRAVAFPVKPDEAILK